MELLQTCFSIEFTRNVRLLCDLQSPDQSSFTSAYRQTVGKHQWAIANHNFTTTTNWCQFDVYSIKKTFLRQNPLMLCWVYGHMASPVEPLRTRRGREGCRGGDEVGNKAAWCPWRTSSRWGPRGRPWPWWPPPPSPPSPPPSPARLPTAARLQLITPTAGLNTSSKIGLFVNKNIEN